MPPDHRRLLTFAAVVCAAAMPGSRAFAQETTRVSTDSLGHEGNAHSYVAALSSDASIVVFMSDATNLVPSDTNSSWDVFASDRQLGVVVRVSVDSFGIEGNSYSSFNSSQAVSSDGNVVVFWSAASNLCTGDANGALDVFTHDLTTGVTERVSVDSSGGEANGDCLWSAISADRNVVAFHSSASNLVPGDSNGSYDVFVFDRVTRLTERVSIDSLGNEGDAPSLQPSISSDGRYVAFFSVATNLVSGDNNNVGDVFVHDRILSTTERVSVNTSTGRGGNKLSEHPSISGDGRFVAFTSGATNLITGDTNGKIDSFVYDRGASLMTRVSVDSQGTESDADCGSPSISLDGTVVVYTTSASNLVAGDTNNTSDCFAHDLISSTTKRVSIDSTGAEGNNATGDFAAVSSDGSSFAFASAASNLVANDTNGFADVFVHELCSLPATWTNYGNGVAGTNGIPSLTSRQNPVLGQPLTMDVGNSYGAPTIGLLIVGFDRGSFHTKYGGDVLVAPFLVAPFSMSFGSNSYTGMLSGDGDFCGTTVNVQVLEADPGAPFGVSFSQGLELALGR